MKLGILAAADSIHSWRWVEYFSGAGHDVHWISMAPFERELPKGVTGYYAGPWPRTPLDYVRSARRIKKAIWSARPDLLHVHYLGTYGVLGALSGFRPIVSTAWGSDVLIAAKNPFKRPFIKHVLRSSASVTCDAYHMRDALVRLGVPAEKIDVIFFGTDVERFRPGQDGAGIRRRHGLTPEHFVLISTRNLYPIYDIATLVRSIPRMAAEIPRFHCLAIGRGDERERLEALARELGVADKITFVGGVAGTDMPLYLAAADAYVSTSLSDAGLAASTAEAMATGLPVVVSDTAENSRWVEHGRGGFIVPAGDPNALATRVIELAHNGKLRRAMGAYNPTVIAERNNVKVEMKKANELYARIGGHRNTSRA